jgi:hypothetical protein
MFDTNYLIKNATFDIISVITIWGLINVSYLNKNIRVNEKIYNIFAIGTTLIGFCASTYILKKYM